MTFDLNQGDIAHANEETTVTLPMAQPKAANKSAERKMKQEQIELDTTERQEAYVAKRKALGGLPNIVTPDAFIRGMRDLGYKDPSWALAELIDNSVQSGCTKAEIRFDFDGANASQAKNPSQIAIIDDGTGMTPEMLPYAVEWGGTDREGDRHGFGRYGYGLPSSCVSIARRYTVYSKVAGSNWHAITVDISEIVNAGNDPVKIAKLLEAAPTPLPKWLEPTPSNGVPLGQVASGTVIVLEDLDRLRKRTGWILVKALKDNLLKQFGLIYRHWLTDIKIVVDGTLVGAIDPLFLMEHARFVDETSIRARKVADHAFNVTTEEGVTGTIRIRASLMPPLFSWSNPEDIISKTDNSRWKQVLAPKHQLNGLLVCREGRQIDVVQPNWTKFQNYDVYFKIEIDFDPVLDELFSITTSKQQVRFDDSLWPKLVESGQNAGGLKAMVIDMRRELKAMFEELDAARENLVKDKATELPAATAMAEAERFRTKTPRLSDQARAEARKNLEEEVKTQAKATGEPVEVVREKIAQAIQKRPWDIEFQAIDEGPFFIPKRLGNQKRILLNTAHAFYSRLYEPASPATKAALDVLLFVLADGEINADDERVQFYRNERGHRWSPMLQHALAALVSQGQIEDKQSVEIENSEMEKQGK